MHSIAPGRQPQSYAPHPSEARSPLHEEAWIKALAERMQSDDVNPFFPSLLQPPCTHLGQVKWFQVYANHLCFGLSGSDRLALPALGVAPLLPGLVGRTVVHLALCTTFPWLHPCMGCCHPMLGFQGAPQLAVLLSPDLQINWSCGKFWSAGVFPTPPTAIPQQDYINNSPTKKSSLIIILWTFLYTFKIITHHLMIKLISSETLE